MPVKVRGRLVYNRDTGKKEKVFKSHAKAVAYAQARNMAHARKKGYKVPKAKKR